MLLRIATYNIHRCLGRDGVQDPERIAGVLQELDCDIIALQEVASLPGSTGRSVLARLAEAAGATPVQGYTMLDRHARYGNALLSRHQIEQINRIDISIKGREPRGVLEIEMKLHRRRVALLATHLGLKPAERRQQIRRILNILQMKGAEVTILLGDINEWFVWGRPLRYLKQYFSFHRAPATFPAYYPIFSLDRIWVHPAESLLSLAVHDTPLSRKASDHLPLVAEIDL